MQVSIVIGNPNPGGRTTRVAEAAAHAAAEAVGAGGRADLETIELAHVRRPPVRLGRRRTRRPHQEGGGPAPSSSPPAPSTKPPTPAFSRAFFDRYGSNGLAGAVALPVMLGAAPQTRPGGGDALPPAARRARRLGAQPRPVRPGIATGRPRRRGGRLHARRRPAAAPRPSLISVFPRRIAPRKDIGPAPCVPFSSSRTGKRLAIRHGMGLHTSTRDDPRPIAMDILFLVLGLIFLMFGRRNSPCVARSAWPRFMNVSPAIIGFTVMGIGTSAPEPDVVAVEAVLAGNAGLAVGNVIGSNIANSLLILGAGALIRPLGCDPARGAPGRRHDAACHAAVVRPRPARRRLRSGKAERCY